MYRKFLFLLYVLFGLSTVSNAQKQKEIPPEAPKLIIGIVVEDMRYDYLTRYWDNFGEDGFKKLMHEGSVCKNANFNYLLTQTSPGFATIATGCNPEVHGVVSDQWYQRLQGLNKTSVYNAKMTAVGTDANLWQCAPTSLLTTTFTDELKLFNNGASKVIGISFKPDASILAVGHLANAAYWFDHNTGNWVSSSYYCDSLPSWVNGFNTKKFPDIYLEREWLPLLTADKYRNGSVKDEAKAVGFDGSNMFARRIAAYKSKSSKYEQLFATPYGNSLTKDFAISAILDEELGKDEFTDYLSIGFASSSSVSQACGPNSVELEDIYIRLDREIAHLLKFVEENLGKHNVMIYLTADHGTAYNPTALKEKGIPAGEFNSDRAIMLLRTYLNAVYDKGNWVSSYYDKQIYLNQNLIEDAGLNIKDVQETVANFIIQFSGVANAITSKKLEETNFTQGVFSKMQNSYNQKRSGDVIINLEPGWIEKGKYLSSANSANRYDVHVPLMWYGWKIKRSKINRRVDMTDVAPTIANFLNIPFPNGCTGEIIEEL